MVVDTIKVHFNALGLLKIETEANNGRERLSLTERGKAELLNLMAVRGKSGTHGIKA